MNKFILACISMCIVELDSGAYSVVVTKYAKKLRTDPLIFCLYRDLFCFPLLFIVAYIFKEKIFLPSRRELTHLAMVGSTGMFLNQLSFLLGVYYTSVDTVALFRPMAPLCAMFLAVIFKLEPAPDLRTYLGFMKLFGVLSALLGALVVLLSRRQKGNKLKTDTNFPLFGYICLICNSVCTGLYITLQKKLIFQNSKSILHNQPITVTAWSYFFGFICMAITSVFYVSEINDYYSMNQESLYLLIYAVVLSSAFSYMLQSWSTIHLKASLVAAFWPLQIFCSVLLAYFVLGEVLSLPEFLGGLFMILGLFSIIWSNYKEELDSYDIEKDSNIL